MTAARTIKVIHRSSIPLWVQLGEGVLSKYQHATTVQQKSDVLVEFLKLGRLGLVSIRGGRKRNRNGRQVNQQLAAALRQLNQVRTQQQQQQQQ
jgi:hypothetical protein